jgi:hypothetical protein
MQSIGSQVNPSGSGVLCASAEAQQTSSLCGSVAARKVVMSA